MSWLNIFKKGDILTQGDRDELEAIEKKAEPYIRVRQRIETDFVTADHRIGRLQALAGELINDIGNEDNYRKMIECACMPSNIQTGYQHREAAAVPFDQKIEEIRQPAAKVVRRVLGRALELAEAELRKVEGREKKESESEGFSYSPSGRVLALQNRVLDLRNAINAKYKFEGATQDPEPWQNRLAEWL